MKDTVVPVTFLTEHHAMKVYCGVTHYLTSALDGGKWSASRPGRFTLRERAPGTHWIGGWVGPRAVLDAVLKRKIPNSRWECNPRTPIVQPVAQRYTDWDNTALHRYALLAQISWSKSIQWGSYPTARILILQIWNHGTDFDKTGYWGLFQKFSSEFNFDPHPSV
jgi:hypothetical protein